MFPVKRDAEQISKVMRANAEKFNWEGIEFPVQVDKISIFENNNTKYGVNVYGYKDDEVYPLRISENDDREQTINLFMISNDKTNHYCWIKNISRLLCTQVSNNNHARYFCERCLNSFKTQKSLKSIPNTVRTMKLLK